MTLLLTVFAAVAATLVWYLVEAPQLHLGVLTLMLWGASIMWLVDAVFEYIELGAAYFTPAAEDMANDAFLGLSVIALALVIWLVVVLVKDSDGRLRRRLTGKK